MAERSPHPATLRDEQLLANCSMQTTRRSGPGGQHRNKVETAVIFTHIPTGIRAEANESRSQAENRQSALFRLRQTLAERLRFSVEPDSPPSELWRSCARAASLLLAARMRIFRRCWPRPSIEWLPTNSI